MEKMIEMQPTPDTRAWNAKATALSHYNRVIAYPGELVCRFERSLGRPKDPTFEAGNSFLP
jgi:hypothetical protein